MNIVLLSGGSGQRLWPLSNDIRSKQFIKIFHTADGELESMVQRDLPSDPYDRQGCNGNHRDLKITGFRHPQSVRGRCRHQR